MTAGAMPPESSFSTSALPTVAIMLAATIAAGAVGGAPAAAAAFAAAVAARAAGARLLAGQTLLCGLVLVILFVPIGRYTLPGSLPFELEPYRVYVAVFFLIWFGALLIDPAVRFHRTLLGPPMLAVLAIAVASDFANSSRVHDVGSIAVKRLTFLASFVLVFFVAVSYLRRPRDVDVLVRLLVLGGSALGLCAIVEYSTGYNVFNDIGKILPLHDEGLPYSLRRGGSRIRAFASSQHPIALGSLEVMLLPLAAYLWQATNRRRWLVAAGVLFVGTFATSSRTPMIMLLVVVLVFLRVRARSVKRLWPALLPAVAVVHFAVPGALGGIKDAFLPQGGLIAQQRTGAGTYGSGRIADLAPALKDWRRHPLVGIGYGTRVTEKGPLQNAIILDDQWLGTLLETGILGLLVWVWTFGRLSRRLLREARLDDTPRGWLCAGLAAAILAFASSMLTLDSFSFIQLTFTLFILLAVSAAVAAIPAETWRQELATS